MSEKEYGKCSLLLEKGWRLADRANSGQDWANKLDMDATKGTSK